MGKRHTVVSNVLEGMEYELPIGMKSGVVR